MTKAASRAAVRRLLAALMIAAAAGCARDELKTFSGVTEGEVVKLAAPVAGNLSSLDVTTGATVTEGTKLFSQAEAGEISAHADAARRLDQIEHGRGKRTGSETEEIESLKAEVAQAEWKLMLKSASAPVNGVVTETLYAKGDWGARRRARPVHPAGRQNQSGLRGAARSGGPSAERPRRDVALRAMRRAGASDDYLYFPVCHDTIIDG